MIDVVKALLDIPLDEPLRPLPNPVDGPQGGVTPTTGPETVRVFAELRLVVGFQDGSHHLLQQFVRPRRDAEGSCLPIGLGNVDPPNRGPSETLVSNRFDDRSDLLQGHPIHGLVRRAFGHRTLVAVDATIGTEVEVWVIEPSIDILQVQSFPASLLNDRQRRFGVLHVAYLVETDDLDNLPHFAM